MPAVLTLLVLAGGFLAAMFVSKKAVPKSYKIFAWGILGLMLFYLLSRTARADEAFKEQPATYKLQLIYVFEGNPSGEPEYILTTGQVGFKSMDALKQAIANYPKGSTLEYAPSCDVMGGEPLRTQKELDDLKAFCEQHKVKFVHIPSG